MTEFLAVSWYIVPAVVLAIVGFFGFIAVGTFWASEHAADVESSGYAKVALGFLSLPLFGAWIWPVLIPTAVLFLVFMMIRDILKKEN